MSENSFGYTFGRNAFPYCTVEAGNSMKAGQDCIELIKKCEGFSKYKYWDYSQWTIGYGTGVGADEYPDGITEEEAEKLLKTRWVHTRAMLINLRINII